VTEGETKRDYLFSRGLTTYHVSAITSQSLMLGGQSRAAKMKIFT